MSYLKFNSQNLKNLHFFTENLNFPIVIGTYSDWQETQVSYLYNLIQTQTTTSICIWCLNHKITFQILYPLNSKQIFRNPYKFLKFLKLKYFLKTYSQKKEKDQK